MVYNRLYINVILRTVFITLTAVGVGLSVTVIRDGLLFGNLVFLLLLQVVLFIRSMNRVNKDLDVFFTSLENNDASFSFKTSKTYSSYKKLLDRMNGLTHRYNNLRMENERQLHYFRAVVENIGLGLMVCDKQGRIGLLNDAGKRILNVSNIRFLEELDVYYENLSKGVMNLEAGQQKLFRLIIQGDIRPIAFKVNDYLIFDSVTRIISFQDIKHELDAQELESWQKLTRVLTHEIMNSTGPIISSIDTIREFLTDEKTQQPKDQTAITNEIIGDVLNGIEIIKERGLGLSEFVKNFRSITISPQLRVSKFQLQELFRHIRFLLGDEMKRNGINLTMDIFPRTLEITADPKLMEQVVLNLVYNAIDAVRNVPDKSIRLIAHQNLINQAVLQVIDNGPGIPEELLDKIFVPFFTTKEKGSGIGLSISRQIMQMHGGVIYVKSGTAGTCFEICL